MSRPCMQFSTHQVLTSPDSHLLESYMYCTCNEHLEHASYVEARCGGQVHLYHDLRMSVC